MAYFKLLHQDLNKLEFKLDSKNRIYFPLLSSSVDHCIAINFLNKEYMTASMYALIRPALESYLRAMWIKHCCGEIPVDADLTTMHIPKRIEVLMQDVDEKVPDFKANNYLQTTLGTLAPNLHDFTHGGIQSIARQYSEDTLTNIRNDKEIMSILKLSVLISSLAYAEIIQDNVGSEVLKPDVIASSALHLLTEL
ncbi:TPA: hypothetical protein KD849_004143 [Vibrio parahaemolyticus]|nr:hypothetical protein [Vibrio parahaemolyticus]HBC3602271.1 hypothetical protein [Vibrio parahaemolyticus]HBC3878341.1 hypothetical protein [Vibrio parahaemolyticus]HBC3936055.1 hypothetical protein [Vibrio parahaemolyticus]